ncbi:hypothetical protein Cpir12675_002759 [Ceratocystis pirilliformis]|uniref:Uncharacterized protein n=1 Tax=Ceratocystis pirilliformis TaxID=259994 RepID=A0ABR3Z748_9PEZI
MSADRVTELEILLAETRHRADSEAQARKDVEAFAAHIQDELSDIQDKYKDMKRKVEEHFPQDHKNVFSSLQAQLGDTGVFPSQMKVQVNEEEMEAAIPTDFSRANWVYNCARTYTFLDRAVEKPSSNILAQYFAAIGDKKGFFFDNGTSKINTAAGTSANAPRRRRKSESVRLVKMDSAETVSRTALPTKPQPDCLVLVRDGWADHTQPSPEPYCLVIGEHKPCHSLRASDLRNSPVLPEDCLIQMASEREVEVVEKEKEKNGKANPLQPIRTLITPSGPPIPSSRISKKLSFFAFALAQAYHYMMMSGLEFGYIATGETMTFLRIPLAEPTTLLYHTSFFPATDPNYLPRSDGVLQYPSGATTSSALRHVAQPDDGSLAELAVSQLCSLCIMAASSSVRPLAWVNEALNHLAKFPKLPTSHNLMSVSPLDLRQCDNNSGSVNENETHSSVQKLYQHSHPVDIHSSNHRALSPLRQTPQPLNGNTHRQHQRALASASIKAVKENKMLPYCTQACLLGLTRRLPLDPGCPNYPLHRDAQPAATSSASLPREQQMHAITKADIRALIREQISIHPENNCTLLYNEGLYGAIGCLFKLSLNGYGYTFVAKGVESDNACRLRRETQIYKRLYRQQGVLIPVHLGLIKLLSPYPFMAKFTTLSHLMLMSYVGKALHYGPSLDELGQELGRDLNCEISDTYQQLLYWGLDDRDEDVCNATWCEETQSVMKIDFDHCILDVDIYAARVKALEDVTGDDYFTVKRNVMAEEDEEDDDDDESGSSKDDDNDEYCEDDDGNSYSDEDDNGDNYAHESDDGDNYADKCHADNDCAGGNYIVSDNDVYRCNGESRLVDDDDEGAYEEVGYEVIKHGGGSSTKKRSIADDDEIRDGYAFKDLGYGLCTVTSQHSSEGRELLDKFEVNKADKAITVENFNVVETNDSNQLSTSAIMASICRTYDLEPDNLNEVVMGVPKDYCLQRALDAYRSIHSDMKENEKIVTTLTLGGTYPDLDRDVWFDLCQCMPYKVVRG